MPELTTDDGLTIVYDEDGVEHRGARPPVILHHGFVADASVNWHLPGVTAALVAAGRHVVALDARGHGRSSSPHQASYYGERRMAGDVSLLIDALAVDEAHLVGYSMGAIVSVIAASADQRIRRLVVGGVGAAVVELGGVDRRVVAPDGLVAALRANDPSTIADPGAAAFRRLADRLGADRLALAAHAEVVNATPIDLAAVGAACLVIAGRDDPLAARPEVLAAALGQAQVVRVAGDHLGAVADPGFATAIVTFLA